MSNGFIKVDILAPTKERLKKVERKNNEKDTTLLEFLEGSLCRMDDSISRKDVSVYWNPPRNTHSDDI